MFSKKHIVAVGAHPDDIEYGCLGTLIMARKASCFVEAVVLTDGGLGGVDRKTESMRALGVAGIHTATWLNRTDGYVAAGADLVSLLEPRFAKADVILTMSQHDTHQDHRACWYATIAAARRRPVTLLSYQAISSTPEFTANTFVDIKSEYVVKVRALRYHASQVTKDYMDEDWMAQWHRRPQAMSCGIDCSEAFQVHQQFIHK